LHMPVAHPSVLQGAPIFFHIQDYGGCRQCPFATVQMGQIGEH